MFENPMLNKEERVLCQTVPEECLRRLVARGALPLERDIAALPPQVAEAVRVIAAGERLTLDGGHLSLQAGDRGDATARTRKAPLPAGEAPAPAPDWVRAFADAYPEFVHRFEALPAVPDEALKTPLPAQQGPAVSDEALKTPLPAQQGPAVPDEVLKTPLPVGEEPPSPPDWVRGFATSFPHVFGLLEQGRMTPHEAVETIRTIDSFLGNYPTGARYAAP